MKLSNMFLILIAGCLVFTAIRVNRDLTQFNPTAVLSAATDTNSVGSDAGSISFKLPSRLTSRQVKLLTLAHSTSVADGFKFPNLLEGILIQESNAGEMKNYKVAGGEFGLAPNKRYYGVAQLKLDAAKDVLKSYPDLWKKFDFQTKTDEEIIAKLIDNDKFNIAIASKYLIIIQSRGFKTPRSIALAFNRGAAGALSGEDPFNYSASVMRHIENLNLAKAD